MVDQLEQRLLGPVDVLEDEHERLLLRNPLGPLAGSPGDFLRARLRLHRFEDPGREPEQVGHGLVLAERPKLLDRDIERVVVGDPGRALDHLGERPVGDTLSVGQAAAREDGCALEALDELAREPALADAGLAVDREQVGAPVAQRAVVGVAQQLELRVAPDERRLKRARPDAAGLAGSDGPPGPQRLIEPLQLDRAELLDLDPPQREPVRARSEHELARLCRLLEARSQRHGLTGREGRLGIVGDDLARLDADARLEPELLDCIEDRKPRADSALGVVLVRLRDPEGGHDGVAGELLDDPAVRDHAVRDAVEERLDTAAHDLRIRARDERGRVDEVDEQDRGELAFHSPSLETTGPARAFRPERD